MRKAMLVGLAMFPALAFGGDLPGWTAHERAAQDFHDRQVEVLMQGSGSSTSYLEQREQEKFRAEVREHIRKQEQAEAMERFKETHRKRHGTELPF